MVDKHCIKCKTNGPFGVNRHASDGLSSLCKKCNAEKSSAYRAANPERVRETQRKSGSKGRLKLTEECRQRHLLSGRVSYKKHVEKRKAKSKRWRENNKQKNIETHAAWRGKNRDRILQVARDGYRRAYRVNPQKFILRQAHRRAANGRASAEAVRARIEFFGGLCAYCKCPYQCIDHVIPISVGGTNWPSNLRPACNPCNRKKYNKTWREVTL